MRSNGVSDQILSGVAVLVGSLLATSCSKEVPEVLKPRPVKTITVAEPASTYERVFSGQLNASEGTGIGFQVGGRITVLAVKVGQRLEKGAILAELDDSDYQNQLSDAEAQHAQAKQELQRTLSLFEVENASRSQLDSATARNQSTEAALEQAKRRVSDCVLRMPYAGLIGNVAGEVQQVVSAGQEIVSIQGNEGLEFQIGVPADLVGEIGRELRASVTISGRDDLSYTGKVTEVSPQMATNTTYPVTIALEDEDSRIRAGMDGVAKVWLPLKEGEIVTIPLECVVAQAGTEPFVWIVRPSTSNLGILERAPVSIGDLRADGKVAVLSGLATGDVVVSRGVHRVEAGLEVRLN